MFVSNDNGGPARSLPTRKKKGVAAAVARAGLRVRRLFGRPAEDDSAEASEAVGYFLTAMTAVAARAYPAWSRILNDGLADCALDFDARRTLFEIHPIDDYFFAAVVALEAVKIRALYTQVEAAELLSEIGEQVDAKAGRHDRVVSDLVFLMIGRIGLGASMERMPYDKAVKAILQQISMDQIDATGELMRDVGFRHLLGEPLAVNATQWWRAFQTKFRVYWNEPEPVYLDNDDLTPAPAVASPAPMRRRVRRRAATF